jgi:hypothetical protein
LFREIFERIATHPKTKLEDKIKAAELLVQAGGSSAHLVQTYEQIANDTSLEVSARLKSVQKLRELQANVQAIAAAFAITMGNTYDIRSRLNAAKLLQNSGASHTDVTQAYTSILDSVNRNDTLSVENKTSFSLKIGVGLYAAGAKETAISLLIHAINSLTQMIGSQSKESIWVNTHSVVSAAEILVNENVQSRDSTISLIDWAVFTTFTSAFSPETIIYGAEAAVRLGDLKAGKNYIIYFLGFKAAKDFIDRITTLLERGFADEVNFSKALKESITVCSGENKEQGLSILRKQFKWFLELPQEKRDQLYVDTYSMITATEILFNIGTFNLSSATSFIRWAVYNSYDILTKEKTIIHAAETAVRLGDLTSARDYLENDYWRHFKEGTTPEFQARTQALKAKLIVSQSAQ